MRIPTPSMLWTTWKQKIASWRPTVIDLQHDYRDMAASSRDFFHRFPTITATLGWGLLLICGIVLGSGLKVLAHSGLTIGHEDYQLLPSDRLYALNALREKALAEGANLPVKPRELYPACGSTSDTEETVSK